MPEPLFVKDSTDYRPATDKEIISACKSIYGKLGGNKAQSRVTPALIRTVKRLRGRGKTWLDVTKATGVSLPTAMKAYRARP